MYKNYLILIMDDIFIYSIPVDMQEIDNKGRSELLGFVEKTLIRK